MNAIKRAMWNQMMNWLCGPRFWVAAQEWVKLYENKELPGEEKRVRVVAMLLEEARSVGMELMSSFANFMVEAAVQYVRQRTQK